MRTFLPLALSFLLMLPASLLAQNINVWSPIAEQVKKSTVQIQDGTRTFCTGWVINDKAKGGKDDNKDVDYVLTAAHCDHPPLFVEGVPATVKAKDGSKDLMVLEVENLDKPALQLADKDPSIGDEIASFGYGYGLAEPMFRVANVANDKTYIPFDGVGGPLITINATFVPGQSGGPVVNHDGQVVMVVQLGTEIVGFGVGAETIKDKVGRFFEKAK